MAYPPWLLGHRGQLTEYLVKTCKLLETSCCKESNVLFDCKSGEHRGFPRVELR